MTIPPTLQALRDFDRQREGFPGEHWFALATGIGLVMLSRRSGSPLVRGLGLAAGIAFAARAASGRDGIAARLRS